MMPGETILSGAPQICGPSPADDYLMHPTDDDGRPVTVDVLWDVYRSAAGYYIGTYCPYCGPYTRESVYFKTREAAERVYKYWVENMEDGKLNVDASVILPAARH